MPSAGDAYDYEYTGLIELIDTDGTTVVRTLRNGSTGSSVVVSAEFEWLRQGGCGGGQFTIDLDFPTEIIHIGQYIRCSYKSGQKWYFGRIESVRSASPGTVSLVTYGLMSALSDVIVGGQAWWSTAPQTFGRYDYFTSDPDYASVVYNTVATMQDFIQRMYDDYIAPWSSGLITLGTIDARTDADSFASLTFRGGESLAEIIRICADLSGGASYGVDANNNFFFIPNVATSQATYVEGVNLEVEREENRDLIYNRLILVGGYVYGVPGSPGFYVWNSHHEDSVSVAANGARTLSVKIPYIRTHVDALNFATGFLEKYSTPTVRYTGSTTAQSGPLYPWSGKVTLTPLSGTTWNGATTVVENFDTCKVSFNEVPLFTFTIGPEPPQYPVPEVDAAGELSDGGGGGGGGGDAGNVSGWCSAIDCSGLEGSLDSCYWPQCEMEDCGFVVTSAFPSSGYVIGDIYYSTHAFCPRVGITFFDMENVIGVYANLGDPTLDPSDYVTRVGTAKKMRYYEDHSIGGCKWIMTGLFCP